MRRLVVGLLVALTVASSLLLAHHASRRVVYDFLHAAESGESSGRPPRTTFADVDRGFGLFVDQVDGSAAAPPLLPLIKAIGLIKPSTILASGAILALIGSRWVAPRRPELVPFNSLLQRIHRSCPSSASPPRSAPMPPASTAWMPPAPR